MRRAYTRHPEVAAVATGRPGRWVIVGSYRTVDSARSVAWRMRTGKIAVYRRTTTAYFEPALRMGADGTEVWVQYVPTLPGGAL